MIEVNADRPRRCRLILRGILRLGLALRVPRVRLSRIYNQINSFKHGGHSLRRMDLIVSIPCLDLVAAEHLEPRETAHDGRT